MLFILCCICITFVIVYSYGISIVVKIHNPILLFNIKKIISRLDECFQKLTQKKPLSSSNVRVVEQNKCHIIV